MAAFVMKIMCTSGAHIDYSQGPVFGWMCWYMLFMEYEAKEAEP